MADPTDAARADAPVPGRDYPADLAQLRAWFPTDEACLDYVDWLRWPYGFICPHQDCEAVSAGIDKTAGTGAIGAAGRSP